MRAEGLRAWFGKSRRAQEHHDRRSPERKVTAIIGPSGCGKSTFIRCLNRMHEVVAGRARRGPRAARRQDIYGARRRPGARAPPRRHGVPEAEPVPDDVDPRQRARRPPPERRSSRATTRTSSSRSALRQAALWDEVKDALDRSGRRALRRPAAAPLHRARLALEPEVVLMDEPCSALDPIATAKIEELIHELSERYTIVIVTHSMQQAARVSRLHGVLLPGRARGVQPDRRASSPSRPIPRPKTTSPAASAEFTRRADAAPCPRVHTDRQYESELRKLREQLLLMGAKVEEMLATGDAGAHRARQRARRAHDRHRSTDQPARGRDRRPLPAHPRQAPAGRVRPALHHDRRSRSSPTSSASATSA